MRSFDSLSEREILALAAQSEEEDGRIYGDFAERLRASYPATADMFIKMQAEEADHRRRLSDQYRAKFGEHLPLIRRSDVRGFSRPGAPIWLMGNLSPAQARKMAENMEAQARQFYLRSAEKTTDASIRQLLVDLAEEERHHKQMAEQMEASMGQEAKQQEEDTRKRLFVLQVVQPGLAGLMDGSVSTLAPLFAAAFEIAKRHGAEASAAHWFPFKVGLAASAGAGISMGFAEALSDDGSLTGRGHPYLRGVVCGLMTTLGGLGHTLPYLVPNINLATEIAVAIVLLELALISWIRHRYMDTPWIPAAIQVFVGGLLVFVTGMIIGSS